MRLAVFPFALLLVLGMETVGAQTPFPTCIPPACGSPTRAPVTTDPGGNVTYQAIPPTWIVNLAWFSSILVGTVGGLVTIAAATSWNTTWKEAFLERRRAKTRLIDAQAKANHRERGKK